MELQGIHKTTFHHTFIVIAFKILHVMPKLPKLCVTAVYQFD